jgi:hypothetical protein
MKLTNTDLQNFVSRIKFSGKDKAKYQKQIDNLINAIRQHIQEHPEMNVSKVVQSGSWRKGTILRRSDDTPLDIDLVFFIEGVYQEPKPEDIHKLNQTIISFLHNYYQNKEKKDFKTSEKTAGVYFKTSKLNVDIVPVVAHPYSAEKVWQPKKVNGTYSFHISSIQEQLDFNAEAKERNSSYTDIVRLIKKWRNYKKLNLPSFAIELIVAYQDMERGVEKNIEEALIRFFLALSNSRYLYFCVQNGNQHTSRTTEYIADPGNNDNNVVEYLSGQDWLSIESEADKAFETLCFAQESFSKDLTLELWQEIFSPAFSIEPLTDNQHA